MTHRLLRLGMCLVPMAAAAPAAGEPYAAVGLGASHGVYEYNESVRGPFGRAELGYRWQGRGLGELDVGFLHLSSLSTKEDVGRDFLGITYRFTGREALRLLSGAFSFPAAVETTAALAAARTVASPAGIADQSVEVALATSPILRDMPEGSLYPPAPARHQSVCGKFASSVIITDVMGQVLTRIRRSAPVFFQARVTNTTSRSATLSVPGGLLSGIEVRSATGDVVWRRGQDAVVVADARPTLMTYGPFESRYFHGQWDQRLPDGAPAPPGKYEVRSFDARDCADAQLTTAQLVIE